VSRARTKFVILLGGTLLVACSDRPGTVQREIAAVVALTVPAETATPEPSILASAHANEATWAFPLQGSWTEYREWVTRRLAPDYRPERPTSGSLVFRRTLPGDVYHLTLQLDPTPIVRARFVMMPF
jgi:hypothetical protein